MLANVFGVVATAAVLYGFYLFCTKRYVVVRKVNAVRSRVKACRDAVTRAFEPKVTEIPGPAQKGPAQVIYHRLGDDRGTAGIRVTHSVTGTKAAPPVRIVTHTTRAHAATLVRGLFRRIMRRGRK